MTKTNAEWFQGPSTGRFITRLKHNHNVRGEGANRAASSRAFLKACDDNGLSKDRKAYRIRKIDIT